MAQQMNTQQMTEELKKNPLHTMVFWGRSKNTITVSYDEAADTAAEVEKNLTAMGFQVSGYGMMRYDGQRRRTAKTTGQIESAERAKRNFNSATGSGYLR